MTARLSGWVTTVSPGRTAEPRAAMAMEPSARWSATTPVTLVARPASVVVWACTEPASSISRGNSSREGLRISGTPGLGVA
mgnify:CR=1 FL=1